MIRTVKNKKILVIGGYPVLIDIVKTVVHDSIEIVSASGQQEGLEQARKIFPDIIILGYMGPQGTTFKFHQELKEGWITRHASLLIAELDPDFHLPQTTNPDERQQILESATICLTDAANGVYRTDIPISKLKEKLTAKLRERENKFQEAITHPDKFCVIWEQIPGRGAFEIQQEQVLENARKAAKGGRIHAISITENPGGNPAIATDVLCADIRKLGIEPLVHVSLKDKSRNECESLLYQLAALGVNNLLVVTGDYPSNAGFGGTSKPVFDLDAVNTLPLIAQMNIGMEQETKLKKKTLAPTNFFTGVSVSPFKQSEAEVMGQYYKLKKKIDAGADFIITQVGYDARKFHELLLWLKMNNIKIPVFAGIFVLSGTTAKIMHANRVPGCVVADKLLQRITEESLAADKGRSAQIERAARMYAIVKGMGYSGAYISEKGLAYDVLEHILNRGEELTPQWSSLIQEFEYPQKNGFYYFEPDIKTGLNLDNPTLRARRPAKSLAYGFFLAVHAIAFVPKRLIFKIMQRIASFIDSTRIVKSVFNTFERWIKAGIFDCTSCGDCALSDVAYLCPISQCPKSQRNGPCGGSFEEWCEVYPNERKCVWVKAYQRLKSDRNEDSMGQNIVPPCDWQLWETSSWLNFYLGKDHVSKRLGLKAKQKKK